MGLHSHHFIGSGPVSEALVRQAAKPEGLLDRVGALVEESGLAVVDRVAVPFPGGGLTLVWVLAESHLVLHYWPEEGSVTLDLHVCDYRESNAARAERLVGLLDGLCFTPGSGRWQRLEVGAGLDPVTA